MNSVGFYDVDGTLLKGYRRPYVGEIHSLVAVDMEQDGIFGTVVAAKHQWVKQGRPAWEAGRGVVI